MRFCNWVISPALGLFHPSKFRLQENFIEQQGARKPTSNT
jgi:hypothetical protein